MRLVRALHILRARTVSCLQVGTQKGYDTAGMIGTAHELLVQFTAEVKANVVLISEQYSSKESASGYLGLSNTAAILFWGMAFLDLLFKDNVR